MTNPLKFLQVILVGTDGSDGALLAMGWAARLARATEASVRAVHVLAYNREFLRDVAFDALTAWRQELDHNLRNKWVAPLAEQGVPHRCSLVEAESPAVGLIHAADREQTNVIVVGATGHSRLAHRALGTTSYSLTQHARRPVIVVPPTWRQPGIG